MMFANPFKRLLHGCVFFVLAAGVLRTGLCRADDPAPAPRTPEDCRKAYWTGRYDLAAEGFAKLVEAGDSPAAIAQADALAIQGEYAEALKALEGVAKQGDARADWRLAMAEACQRLGQYEKALEHVVRSRAIRDDWAPSLFVHGDLLETLGCEKEAINVYREMNKIIDAGKCLADPRSLVALGKILDRLAILTGRPASDQAQNILSNYFEKAYHDVGKEYWPANVAAGMFLLSKHKPAQAENEFKKAEKWNPRIPDVKAAYALMSLESWKFEDCLAQAEKALSINPNHDLALYAQAACYMQWRKFERVPPILEKILAVNPNHVDALSLMAAAQIRMDRPDQARLFEDRVRKINPRCATPPLTIGQWLEAGRQYDQAKRYLRQAHELAPHLAEPLAELGKIHMQTGEEEQARELLARAHQLDDFRGDVVNYLNIARKLKYFAARESEHFIVKVDERYDRVLLDLVSDYMEEIYPEVCGDYGYEPKHKVIVEIMPFQDQFSLRIAGRGWVPTVGACTGPVIVLTAPNKSRPGVPLGLHNWAAVLRHEFAHAVTLEQTRNRIPHWLTEACAVWQQQDKRAYRYIMTLVSATQNNHLFSVRDLDWGFIRPKRRGDRQLAYAQSEWIMDHIIRTRGFETIRNMLRAFGEGMSQEDVFDKIVGWPGETAEEANGRKYTETLFDKDFRAWAGRMVREWGFDPEPILQSADTAKLIRENPEDADAHAKHALALMRPNAAAAEAAAHKALEIDERNVLALRVLANLFFNRKLYVAAEDVCRKLEAIDPANKTAPKILARCYLAKKKWPDAVAALELLQTRHPLDAFSYTELAKLHVQLGQPEKALPSLIHLHKHSMGDPQYARQIAEIHRSLGQYDQALRYFREVTHINPYETTAYEGIAGVCVRTKDYDRAQAAAVNMTLVEPEKAKSWNYLATVRYRAGKNTKNADLLRQARRDAEKAKQLEPNPLSDQIVEHIDAALTSLQEKP